MSSPISADPSSQASEEALDRVDELLSLFFDDCLDERQVAELNDRLLADPAARARCFSTAQLHADLQAFYRSEPDADSKPSDGAPILGLPFGPTPPVGVSDGTVS